MKSEWVKSNLWVAIVFLLFWIVYQRAGTLVYIDGDDATSIAYHVMGRDKTLQSPYSPYHGMMDKMLSLLLPQEEMLRTYAFITTRLANIIMLLLILTLIFEWVKEKDTKKSSVWYILTSITVLLAIPELFYLGLVYAPTCVAMCFILFSHLITRRVLISTGALTMKAYTLCIIALVAFGFGVAFRWNTIAYGLVIVADLIMIKKDTPLPARLKLATTWGSVALVFSFLMIGFSGYGFADFLEKFETILHVINQTGSLSNQNNSNTQSLAATILTLSPLFTPFCAFAVLIGTLKLLYKRSSLLFVVGAGIISALPWFGSGVPKFIITALPAFILLFITGLMTVTEYVNKQRIKSFYIVGFIILLAPWLVGISITREDTAWGPGFTKKPYDYPETQSTSLQLINRGGFAFPTPEGIRPLYGHFYVLWSEWKMMVEQNSAEREAAIQKAIELNIPLVVTSWSPDYYLNYLYSIGYQTTDSNYQQSDNQTFYVRNFYNAQGQSVSIFYLELEGIEDSELINYLSLFQRYQEIIFTGYSQTLRSLYFARPDALQKLSTAFMLIDINQLITE